MNRVTDFKSAEKSVFDMIKRIFDIVFSALALILLSPVFLAIAVAVKLEDGGSVFYRHNRIGKHGCPICVWKFRTMYPHADRLEECLSPEQIEEYCHEFKLEDDPRITKTGRFLRVTSLDELPQLLNILKGNMSLVGPRPLVRNELLEKYTEAEREKLLSVKPGLTGLWQVSGRNNCTYQNGQRQRVELSYIERRNFLLDITILFKTVLVVFQKEGAW